MFAPIDGNDPPAVIISGLPTYWGVKATLVAENLFVKRGNAWCNMPFTSFGCDIVTAVNHD